jgi:hypothetical protein
MRHNPLLYATIGGTKYRVVAKKKKARKTTSRRKPTKRRASRRRSTTRRRTITTHVHTSSHTSTTSRAGSTDSKFLGIGLLGLLAIGGVALLLLRKKETVVVPTPVASNSGTPFPMKQPALQLTPEQQGQNLYAALQMIKAQ